MSAQPTPAANAGSRFDQLSVNLHDIANNKQAVRAAVVAVAKDMEFIGKGGFLMPEMEELKKFVRNCVPHIVRGEYIDSYFMNQDHGREFWKLRGRGFKADETLISEALQEIEPIYETIIRSFSDPKSGATSKTTSATTIATAPIMAEARTMRFSSQELTIYQRFNELAAQFGIDSIDIAAELREGTQAGQTKELRITHVESYVTSRFEMLKIHGGFTDNGSGQFALFGDSVRDILLQLNHAMSELG